MSSGYSPVGAPPSHQTISGATAPPGYPGPGEAPAPYYGPPAPGGGGMYSCQNCGSPCIVEWPVGWIILTVLFLAFPICLICVFSDRKLRCYQCGNVQPYPGGGGC